MKRILIILSIICSHAYGQNVVTIGAVNASAPVQYGVSLKNSGILSDADLSLFSTSFGTDQTSAIQTILNTASASSPLYLFWDVKASCTGLRIKSYTTIVALQGCGAILRDGANNWLLSNYNWTANSNVLVDSNITINGGIWNGDGWRGATNYQANNTAAKGQITVVNFFGTKNVILQNATFFNSSTWCVTFITSQNIKIDNCIIDDGPNAGIYQDGIDFLGYANHVRVTNCTITNGDDRLVLCPNSTGGILASINHSAYTGVDGDETDIVFSNINFKGVGKGCIIYDAGGNMVKDVLFENIFGTAKGFWGGIFNKDILSGYTLTTGSKIPTNIVFSNIDVDVSQYNVYEPSTYPMMALSCSMTDVTFNNIKRTDYTLANETFGVYSRYTTTPIVINNLMINGFKSFNTAPAQNVDMIYAAGTIATVNNLFINNCNVDLGSSTIAKSFINVRSGATITNINTSNNNVNNLKYFLSNAGTITNARVNGTTHTGQGGSDPTIYNTGTFTKLWMSNWIGVLSTSGTIGTLKGDAFL